MLCILAAENNNESGLIMNTIEPFIASIAYKSDIESLCRPLKFIGDIRYFVSYIIFNDGSQFVLSSTPANFLSNYWCDKLNSYDYSAKIQTFGNADHYFCRENLGAEPIFKEKLEEEFNLYRTFYMSRTSLECRFVFGALHDHHVQHPQFLYKRCISQFEDFCIDFLDNMVNVIKHHNPNYNRSIILNDKYYRKETIKGLYAYDQKLTEREIECLYWAAYGKSSDETAIILNIKKSTVEEYKKQIKKKLNCSNLTQAVYEAVKRGYIGAFNRMQVM